MTFPAWFVYLLIAVLALDAISKVLLIGEPREPMTKGAAVWSVLWSFVAIVVLALWVLR
ncbi:MAG TPA: hypothetical protein VFE45_09680 [Coriobacteriia bacterium]|nr:hypothetical protein [Coriobacteriia bacterium]